MPYRSYQKKSLQLRAIEQLLLNEEQETEKNKDLPPNFELDWFKLQFLSKNRPKQNPVDLKQQF